jgi:parvulin-like peptidyl-prolyl isomerase
MSGVEPYFVGGVFDIEEVGGYSGVVDSKFGLHIIRLDDIKLAHYLPYEEVKDQIIADLRNEYIKLAAKEFDADFRITDDTYIDADAVEEILQPYKTAE